MAKLPKPEELPYVQDHWACDLLGDGVGGVSISQYVDYSKTLKAAGDEYVAKNRAQCRARLGPSHTAAMQIWPSFTAMALFIGYLVSGATSHGREWYWSPAVAFMCIQIRAFAAVVCTCSLIINFAIQSHVSQILSVPGWSKLDGKPISQEQQVAWVYMEKVDPIRRACKWINLAGFIVFVITFVLDTMSVDGRPDNNFIFLVTASSIAMVATAVVLWNTAGDAKIAMASMGYNSSRMCGIGSWGQDYTQTQITYTSGLPGDGYGAYHTGLGRGPMHSMAQGGSSMI